MAIILQTMFPMDHVTCIHWGGGGGGGGGQKHELLNLRALKISMLYKIISFNVWVRYLTRTLNDVDFIHIFVQTYVHTAVCLD